jgi:hypothetical protein
VTRGENLRRGDMDRLSHTTHCKHGHEYTAANTYLYRGTRNCRACRRAAVRRASRREATTISAEHSLGS